MSNGIALAVGFFLLMLFIFCRQNCFGKTHEVLAGRTSRLIDGSLNIDHPRDVSGKHGPEGSCLFIGFSGDIFKKEHLKVLFRLIS